MNDRFVEAAEKEEYLDFLRQLVANDGLTDDAAIGITKQVIAKGRASLSAKQEYVFQKQVVEEFPQPSCKRCAVVIPWNEVLEHRQGSGLCGGCVNAYEKFMED